MPENFTLMDKVINPKKFTFEEAARIATVEKWRSYFNSSFRWEPWNEAFYLMVNGESVTLDEFKKDGKKTRIFGGYNSDENKNFCIELQRKLATANIKKILENHKHISTGLLILGVALRYVEGVEQYNKILTSNWIPKFYRIFTDKRRQVLPQVKKYYQDLQDNQGYLTYNNLDILNNQYWFENKI